MTPSLDQVAHGIQLLKRGRVIAFPTDTVYGLGADAFNCEAIDKVYQAKHRSRMLPLPLLLKDAFQMSVVARDIPEIAWFLADFFWPGGITLVLPRATWLSSSLAPDDTVAVRVPNHDTPLALIQGLGNPIVGTSANISGKPGLVAADDVRRQMGDVVDFIIEENGCSGSMASTVVDITGDMPVILRQGIIPSCEVKEAYAKYRQRR